MSDNPEPKIATDPDWFWRDANAGRAAGLYGEILPERPKLEPEIIQKWEQTSQTEYVLHIAPGIKWHNKPPVNGRELTSEDICIANAGVVNGVSLSSHRTLLVVVGHRHPLSEADGHAAFLRVAKHERLVGERVDRYLVIEEAPFG